MTKEQEIAQFWVALPPMYSLEGVAEFQKYRELIDKFRQFQRLARESWNGGKPQEGDLYWCIQAVDPRYSEPISMARILWPGDASVFAKCYFRTRRCLEDAIVAIGGPGVLYEIRDKGVA